MSHTTLPHPKYSTRDQLLDFALNRLEHQLATHALLRALIGARLTTCIADLRKMAGPPAAPDKPNFDTYVSPALVQQNKEAASSYFGAVGIYGLGLAEEVPTAHQEKLAQTLASRKSVLDSLNKAYEQGDISYQGALGEWEKKAANHPQVEDDYKKEIGRLRTELYQMVKTFNDRSIYDEALEVDDIETFCLRYERWVPTHSFYNGASGGTLYYDYQNNSFQVHIHCAKHATKSSATRIKRYGQQHGVKKDGNWGMVDHLLQNYPPNWTGGPRPL